MSSVKTTIISFMGVFIVVISSVVPEGAALVLPVVSVTGVSPVIVDRLSQRQRPLTAPRLLVSWG